MNLAQTLFEVIDMRSFSNLWFWIWLAVLWTGASHWVIGIPYDMIVRARRHGGAAQEELELLAQIRITRLLRVGPVAGMVMLGFVCFALTALAILGFRYGIEFAQAVFLLVFPIAIVALLSMRLARRVAAEGEGGEVLVRHLLRHRHVVQTIGMISIFATAMWGMYQNLVLVTGF